MNLDEYDYELPQDLIAQQPVARRGQSRLMVVHTESCEHLQFDQLPSQLDAGDLLIVNDTRVLPARLWAEKPSGGRVELLLIEECSPNEWQAWIRATRKPEVGQLLRIGDRFTAELLRRDGRDCLLRLTADGEDVAAAIERYGRMPLPPYIRRERGGLEPNDGLDRERYQTVYAARRGAVAAPTAGLHFSPELLERLDAAGIPVATVTLHVGPGTFQPLEPEMLEKGELHRERYEVPDETVAAIEACRIRGGRVVAVGTTSVRALESASDDEGRVTAGPGTTRLFIQPGYRFRVVDRLITNFHLPRSSLMMLVCAFAGQKRLLDAYRAAVSERYRFFSYGDAMLLERV
jgi:S-adenosylmethionine:tRNA ribosyltransferase-isomerase